MKRSTRPLFAAVAAAVLVQIGPAAAAKLWVKNETRQSLSVFVDASRRCELAMEKSCTIELTRGSHQLRLQRSDGLN